MYSCMSFSDNDQQLPGTSLQVCYYVLSSQSVVNCKFHLVKAERKLDPKVQEQDA